MTTSDVPAGAVAVLALGLAFISAAGCGNSSGSKVRGTVTFDGKPLKNGSIEFFPLGKTGQSAGAPITNGMYEVDASVGEMKVSINGSEVVGQQKAYDSPDSPMVNVIRNPIPAKYNTQSQLKSTLVVGPNEVNFDLKSDKK